MRNLKIIFIFLGTFSHLFAETMVDTVLTTLRQEQDDLSIRTDLTETPFKLPVIDRVMTNPLTSVPYVQDKIASVFNVYTDVAQIIKTLTEFSGTTEMVEILKVPVPLNLYEIEYPPSVPKDLQPVITNLISTQATVKQIISRAYTNISDTEREQINRLVTSWVNENPLDYVPSETQTRDEWRIETIKLMQKYERKELFLASCLLARIVKDSIETFKLYTSTALVIDTEFNTPVGKVRIGDTSNNTFTDDVILNLDFGGDDVYTGAVATGIEGEVKIVIDLAGNDLYRCDKDTGPASGYWGIGMLYDCAGDDVYQTKTMAIGCGIFGTGVLVDESGNDIYQCKSVGIAASFIGYGMLVDYTGNDIYTGSTKVQSYAGTDGISVLLDYQGDDTYRFNSETSDPREPSYGQSMGQGFATGIRGYVAGGLAVLADGTGNDTYRCDYFGQGSSYFLGLGVLYDESGNDIYTSRRYSQGTGVHLSAGILLDVRGDDNYITWAVSQGCGHDYSIGILVDETGNDNYVSDWSVQGAGLANGLGILVDNHGNDSYLTRDGLGIGQYDNDRKSAGLGFFLDAQGSDFYARIGKDNTTWLHSRWGAGFDSDGTLRSGINLVLLPTLPNPAGLSKLQFNEEREYLEKIITLSELIVSSRTKISELLEVASYWGMEKDLPDRAKEKLVNFQPETVLLTELTGLLDIHNTGLIFVLEDLFTLKSASAVNYLIAKSTSGTEKERVYATYFLSKLRVYDAVPTCSLGLTDTFWRVRNISSRAIGEMFALKHLQMLDKITNTSWSNKESSTTILSWVKEYEIERWLKLMGYLNLLSFPEYKNYTESIHQGEQEQNKTYTTITGLLMKYYPRIVLVAKQMKEIIVRDRSWIVTQLIPLLHDKDHTVRHSAVTSLGMIADDKSVPFLVTKLRDKRSLVRDAAVLALGNIGEKAVSVLDKVLRQEVDGRVRALLVEAIGRTKSPSAYRSLTYAVNDNFWLVRLAAVDAISATVPYKKSGPLIKKLSGDENSTVRTRCVRVFP